MEVNLRLSLVRSAIHLITFRQRRRFENALRNPKKYQQRVLGDILNLTKLSRLPEQPTEFRNYPSDESWTIEPILFFETTSGNSGKKKSIPYTSSLLKSFQNLFLLWVDDVLQSHNLKTGKLFISVSPKLESLGMNSDLDYLSPWLRKLLGHFLTASPSDFVANDGHDFFRKIAIRLLNDSRLESISIWSPTYFLSLLSFIEENVNDFVNLVSPSVVANVRIQNWNGIWPELKIISCWTDGSSLIPAQRLKEIFPAVNVQGKGLLSTEAPMTIPWTRANGCVPLWSEVYLECIDVLGNIKPLCDIAVGDDVEILVSTKGGLLRYRMGDIVRCTHFYKATPVLKFVRRAGDVSDLVGEKLDSAIVQDLFSDLLNGRLNGHWFLVANSDHYVFVSDFEIDTQEIERRLNQSFHYGLARELKQLKSARVRCISDLGRRLMVYYADRRIKLGDIKERLLWTDSQILSFLESSRSPEPSL